MSCCCTFICYRRELLNKSPNFCLRKTLFNYYLCGSGERGNLGDELLNIYSSLGCVDELWKNGYAVNCLTYSILLSHEQFCELAVITEV